MADRYCRYCGQELKPGDKFCIGCGRSVYATAHVPTPEADVPVPPTQAAPPLQQDPQHSGAQDATKGPKWAMLAVFLVLLVGRTAMGMAEPIVVTLSLAVFLLFVGGVYYVTARKDGVTFGESVFNWPMVILAGAVVFFAIV